MIKKPEIRQGVGVGEEGMVLDKLGICMQKTANSAILITLHKTQVHMDQRLQHKTRYTEPDRGESEGYSLECNGTVDDVLNRTLIVTLDQQLINGTS